MSAAEVLDGGVEPRVLAPEGSVSLNVHLRRGYGGQPSQVSTGLPAEALIASGDPALRGEGWWTQQDSNL